MNASDQRLWQQVAESAVGRLAGSMVATVTAARSESVAARKIVDAANAWRRFSPSAKWQFIGIALGTAVITHLVLLMLQRPEGWWWWAIPAFAGVFAVLLLVLSAVTPRSSVSD